jgi:hypothetical protein
MKRFFLFLILLTPNFLFSQEDSTDVPDSIRLWHRGGMASLNFTQASFTNWAPGGENSISGQSLLGFYLNYRKDSTIAWENNLDFAFGLQKLGIKVLLKKTDDKIEFASKYSLNAFSHDWYYSALFDFKSQFAPGYTYLDDTSRTLISEFMSPAYTVLALGLDYRPDKKFSLFIAPLTIKTTYVMNQMLADAGSFGVEKAEYDTAGNKIKDGQRMRNEFGGYVRIQYKAEIMKNVTLKTKFEFFSNYVENPQNIDFNGEVLLTMKVNKFLSASLTMQGVYDNDINISIDKNNDGIIDAYGPRFQFTEVLGVGLAAKF